MVALPEATKYQVAVGQIKSIEGVDAQGLLSTFDGMRVTLSDERSHFDDYIQKKMVETVDPLQNKIDSLSQRINDLQVQLNQAVADLGNASTEKTAAQSKIENAKADFATAESLMISDIERDKLKFTALLQG